MITDDEIQAIAASAYFKFDVDLKDGGDTYFVVGDGTDDLDSFLKLLAYHPRTTFMVDVSPPDTAFKAATANDVVRIRDAFMTYYTGTSTGTLYKPDVYQIPVGVALHQDFHVLS